LDNFQSELAGATLKVGSSRVYWQELLGVRQALGKRRRERLKTKQNKTKQLIVR